MAEKGAITSILFDLDQTLTDRPASIALIAKRWMEEFGFLLPECSIQHVCECMHAVDGKGYRSREDFMEGLLESMPWTRRPDTRGLLEFWQHEFPRCAVARPEASKTLKNLVARGYKIGVVTNGSTGSQNGKLDAMGLRKFLSCVVVSETVGIKKPDPRIFQLALDDLKSRGVSTAFVGDNPELDILPTRKLGMTPIWLAGIFQWPVNEPAPKFTIHSLDDLNTLL